MVFKPENGTGTTCSNIFTALKGKTLKYIIYEINTQKIGYAAIRIISAKTTKRSKLKN